MSTTTWPARSPSPKNPPAALVQTQLAGAVGTITLDHAAKRNALGQALVGQILAALAELEQGSARAVIVPHGGRRQGVFGRARHRRTAPWR